MKKRVIKIAALVVLFAAVLVISNVILNRGNDDQVVDMGDATLPRVSFPRFSITLLIRHCFLPIIKSCRYTARRTRL